MIDEDDPTLGAIDVALGAALGRDGARSGVRPPLPPVARLALVVLTDALGRRTTRRLSLSVRPVLVCLDVPDADWFEPVRAAVRTLSRTAQVKAHDATARRPMASEATGDVLHEMSKGHSVVCVSQGLAVTVPGALTAAADVRVTLAEPTAAQVARAMASLCGDVDSFRDPESLPRGLRLTGIAGCLRPGEPGRTMVRRLRKAAAVRTTGAVDASAPTLDELHGYGAVADWGRRMVVGVARHRAGEAAWREVADPVVLHGLPGTGKTLFARALARSCGVPLVATSVGAWFQGATGDLGATVRNASAAFQQARAAAKEHGAAVLLVDELDSLPNRSALSADHGSWWRPVVNHVLTLVDGAVSDIAGVVLLAATNDIAAVDPALLRPGRFGTVFRVDPPSIDDLARIVSFHLHRQGASLPCEELTAALRPAEGATQAAAASWSVEAMRRAKDQGRPVRVRDVVESALPADDRHPDELRRAAVHEVGHAVAAWRLAPDRLISTSIHGSAQVGGTTALHDRLVRMLTRVEFEDDIVLLLSGRAADVLVGDGANSGAGAAGPGYAASDLGRATRMLADLHGSFGLGGTLRTRHASSSHGSDMAGGDLAIAVEADLQRLMRQTEALVTRHAAAVRAVADALLRHRFITGEEVGGIAEAAGLGSSS